jgi:phosphoglycolate phosphatase-like HAD superfamily hydrolase
LRRLKAAGFHLFTLTDNTAAISGRQLTHGGIVDLFDRRFSVDDTAKRHKPAPEAYAEVTRGLGVSPFPVRHRRRATVQNHFWLLAGRKGVEGCCHTYLTLRI